MHPRLLEYFNQELLYMRDSALEFARRHPHVAPHLGIGGSELRDPYVERLIEAFCLLSARTRLKLDAEFPRFAQRLLEVLHPQFLAPFPAAGVVRMQPDTTLAGAGAGLTVPRGSEFVSHLAEHPQTPVQWRSVRDVVLWPLRIEQARLDPGVPDLGALAARGRPARACLRLRVRMQHPWRVEQLAGFDELRLQLCGDVHMASRVFELLHTGFVACCVAPCGEPRQARLAAGACVAYDGMRPGEGLLPLAARHRHAHQLVQEYFHAPQCLLEATVRGLRGALAGLQGEAFELWLLLDRDPGDLGAWLDADAVQTGCVPVVNLFPARCDRIDLSRERCEYHIVADRARPLDFEIWSIDELLAQPPGGAEAIHLRPLYRTVHRDGGDHGRYFSMRREQRVASDAVRRWGARSPYLGTEVFVSLVDQHDAPFALELQQLSVSAWMSNRDLPLWLGHGAARREQLASASPVQAAELLGAPSPPRESLAAHEGAWSLIRLLAVHHLPLAELDAADAAAALREYLSLFASPTDPIAARQIGALAGARLQVATRRLAQPGPLVFGRALLAELELDDAAFAPGSALLFGMVLERLLAQHVGINTCSQTALHSQQRGELWRGPMRMGEREAP